MARNGKISGLLDLIQAEFAIDIFELSTKDASSPEYMKMYRETLNSLEFFKTHCAELCEGMNIALDKLEP